MKTLVANDDFDNSWENWYKNNYRGKINELGSLLRTVQSQPLVSAQAVTSRFALAVKNLISVKS